MPDPTDHAVELFNQALELRAQGDLERAESLCVQAIEIFQNVQGENSPDAANLLSALTHWRDERGDYDGAIDAAQRAVRILDALELPRPEGFSENPSGLSDDAAHLRIEAWSNLGNSYRQLARYPKAEKILKGTLALAIEIFGEASDEASNARNNLGILYRYTGNFDAAHARHQTKTIR